MQIWKMRETPSLAAQATGHGFTEPELTRVYIHR